MYKFKELFIKSGYKECYIADKLGVTKPVVSAWSRGIRFPSCRDLYHLCRLIGADMMEIVRKEYDVG